MLPVLLACAALVVAGVLVSRAGGGGERPAGLGERRPGATAAATVHEFLSRYVDRDGRVVRHDEGGDTVSEGQAYAMLLAVTVGDRERFEKVWGWTRRHLQRPDGLLSWHWRDGRVVDESPATDADLDAARALALAAERFGAPPFAEQARRIAAAVLEHETVEVGGDLVLVAGPWARERRVVNPSYVSPCTYGALGTLTGDPRWERLRASGHDSVDALTAGGRLPPDWAHVVDGGRLLPAGSPDGGGSPRYGLDASRVPLRMAEGCDRRSRDLAARMWPALRKLDGRGAAVAYDLEGRRLDRAENPVGLVAAAAAARSSGDEREARRLLDLARAADRRHRTYYGAAWVALGHVLLGEDG